MFLEYLHGWRLHNLSEQPLPVLSHSKKMFPHVQREPPVLQFSSMKMLNGIGPSIDPWDTPLVTGIPLVFVPLITSLWAHLFSQFSIHLQNSINKVLLPGRLCCQTPSADELDGFHWRPANNHREEKRQHRGFQRTATGKREGKAWLY